MSQEGRNYVGIEAQHPKLYSEQLLQAYNEGTFDSPGLLSVAGGRGGGGGGRGGGGPLSFAPRTPPLGTAMEL